jgi:DnaJ-domain-containing protein 1
MNLTPLPFHRDDCGYLSGSRLQLRATRRPWRQLRHHKPRLQVRAQTYVRSLFEPEDVPLLRHLSSSSDWARQHVSAQMQRLWPPRVLGVVCVMQVTASAGDAHSLLGVPQGAPKDVIKRAYRKLVLRTHPDIARDGGSEERFIQVRQWCS